MLQNSTIAARIDDSDNYALMRVHSSPTASILRSGACSPSGEFKRAARSARVEKCDVNLVPPRLEKQRASLHRSKKRKRTEEDRYDDKTHWRLDVEIDRKLRRLCEAT